MILYSFVTPDSLRRCEDVHSLEDFLEGKIQDDSRWIQAFSNSQGHFPHSIFLSPLRKVPQSISIAGRIS